MPTVGTRTPAYSLASAIVRGGLLAWMSTGFLCSQPTFEHVVPAPGVGYPVAVRQTVDGGYLLAGYTAPSGGYDQDGYLALLSPNGEETSAHPLNNRRAPPSSTWISPQPVSWRSLDDSRPSAGNSRRPSSDSTTRALK